MKRFASFFVVLVIPSITSLSAADWSQFRGPGGTGIAVGAKPPTTWSDAANLKWKAELPGAGASSPVIAGQRVFVTCWSGTGAEMKRELVCVNRGTGTIQWAKTIPTEARVDRYDGFMQEHGYASHTPVCDGERVYAFFGKAGAFAFDLDGKQLWSVNLGTSANAKNWGSASSPVLHKDTVIISASEESHTIYALDKKTGKEVWKSEGAALDYVFGTPTLITHNGQTDLVVSLPEELWALNPDTGKLRWFAETGLTGNVAPSAVAGSGEVFAFGGFPRLGAVAVKLGGKGDVTKSHVSWTTPNSTYIPTPVLHEGRLYFVTDAGFATCLEAKSGEQVFKERLPGASATGRGGKPFYASAVLANGNVYAVSRRNGVFVIAAKPQFTLVAQNKLTDDTQFNATPSFAGDDLLLRSDKFLYCLGTKGAK